MRALPANNNPDLWTAVLAVENITNVIPISGSEGSGSEQCLLTVSACEQPESAEASGILEQSDILVI